jgi:hypothetical protein
VPARLPLEPKRRPATSATATTLSGRVLRTIPIGGELQETPAHGVAVYAIPRSAVVRRRQDSLLLGAPRSRARGTWLMHVLQAKPASWALDVVRGPADEATRARRRVRSGAP